MGAELSEKRLSKEPLTLEGVEKSLLVFGNLLEMRISPSSSKNNACLHVLHG